MSEIKVNKISPKQTCTQLTLGDSGDTIIIPAGATITNNGTATGFGATGAVNWDTTPKTTTVSAVSGSGYFIDTTSGAITVNLPATPTAGNIVAIADYNGTSGANNITVGRNSSNINGSAANFTISNSYAVITFVYVNATAGWRSVSTSNTADVVNSFVSATGGTITTCGDYKIHTFTGPGTFTVNTSGTGSSSVDYLVVGGGGAGANGGRASGGGAGGFRESKATGAPWTASPLASSTSIPVSVTAYPITVGAGGSVGNPGGSGSSSIFSTITSAGGGGGVCSANGIPGASGGGSACVDGNAARTGGSGNTPPVSPPQGSPGGSSPGSPSGGYRGAGAGGGGATESGVSAPSYTAGRGGAGATTSISGSSVAYAGGGGGGSQYNAPPGYPAGTPGGASPCGTGGQGAPNTPGQNATAGTTNRGGGGGGSTANFSAPFPLGGGGGSGIVIIRYKYQ